MRTHERQAHTNRAQEVCQSSRMSEWDAVQAACRRASAMKTAAGALASLASSSVGMPASLVQYVAELTTTDMPIDSGVISRFHTWLATIAPRSAIARGPRNAMHGMSAAGTHALQRLVTVILRHSELGLSLTVGTRRRI